MRVAVVSDIHGSLAALEAVVEDIGRRAPDVVVHGGDLVLMGPDPAGVVDRVRELGWEGVVGNTDELLWQPGIRGALIERAPKLRAVIDPLFDEFRPATLARLGEERLGWLRRLPAELRVGDLAVVHAAPGDLWRAPMPDASDAELEETYEPMGAAQVAYGHIHRPFARTAGSTVVANSGSVGLPWDGDPRPAYLIVDDGTPEIVRVEHDAEADAALLLRSGYPDAERLAAMRRSGRFIRPEPS